MEVEKVDGWVHAPAHPLPRVPGRGSDPSLHVPEVIILTPHNSGSCQRSGGPRVGDPRRPVRFRSPAPQRGPCLAVASVRKLFSDVQSVLKKNRSRYFYNYFLGDVDVGLAPLMTKSAGVLSLTREYPVILQCLTHPFQAPLPLLLHLPCLLFPSLFPPPFPLPR